jgi:hypothetical protein
MGSKSLPIVSERQRILAPLVLAFSSTITRDLPRDTVLKYLTVTISGAFDYTFLTATPIAQQFTIMDALIADISIVVNGSNTIKNIRPWMLAMQQLLFTSATNVRQSQNAATAILAYPPNADAGFIFGVTTTFTGIRESVLVAFENIACKIGREATWLNLKGVASAEIRFSTRAITSLLSLTSTATALVFGATSNSIQIELKTIEAQDVDSSVYFSFFKQTQKSVQFSGQGTNVLIDINRGNSLQGLMLLTQNGAASAILDPLLTDDLITDFSFKLNGQTEIKANSWLGLKEENQGKFGVNAALVAGASRLKGFAYLDFLRDGNLNTALQVSPPDVDNAQLSINTAAASTRVIYGATQPALLTIVTNEIVTP